MRSFVLILSLFISSLSTAQDLVEFENGQVADAEDINANFDVLKSRIDQTDEIFGLSCPEGTFVTGISFSKNLICGGDTGSSTLDLAYSSSYGAIDLSAAGDALAISHFSDGSVQNAVRVFYRQSASKWFQLGEDVYVDLYGQEIAISGAGDTVVVGDPIAASRKGKAFVWQWLDDEWTQRGSTFAGASSYDLMRGSDLNYAGNVLALDEFQYGNRQGRVRSFDWDGLEWQADFSNVGGAGERIQYPSLSSNGNTIAYGSSLTTGSDPSAEGFVRVFQKVNTDWIQKGIDITLSGTSREIKPFLNRAGDQLLLLSLDASGDGLVCQAHIVQWNASDATWSTSDPIRFGSTSQFASCKGKLSGDATTVIVGNAEASSGDYSNAGSVYVLRRSGSQWVNILEYSGTVENERLGVRLAISEDGNTFAYSRLGFVEIVSH